MGRTNNNNSNSINNTLCKSNQKIRDTKVSRASGFDVNVSLNKSFKKTIDSSSPKPSFSSQMSQQSATAISHSEITVTGLNSTDVMQLELDNIRSSLEDATNSEVDEEVLKSNSKKYRNKKRKSKFPVRDFFIIDGNSAFCEACQVSVKISSRSDANMRTHLANHHDMKQALLPSQIARKDTKIKCSSVKLSVNEKRFLNDEMINCIITDSRTFNDFNKPGMRRFLNVIKPGYKPCCREKVGKEIKKK